MVKIGEFLLIFLKTPVQYYNEAVLVQLSWAKNLLSTQILALPEIYRNVTKKNTVTISHKTRKLTSQKLNTKKLHFAH